MATKRVHVLVFKDPESEQWAVECLEYGVASQGDSLEHALEMIKEAVQLHLEDRDENDLDYYQPVEGTPEIHTITIDAPSLLHR